MNKAMRINRKIPFIIISLFLSISINSFAHEFEVDGIYYNILSSTDKTVEVTYKGRYFDSYSNEYTGSVTIPETVAYSGTNYSVTEINGSAFRGCDVTSVTIPNSVTSIGSSAFSGCSGLTSVTIPNSVTSIGNYAFYDCDGLTSVTIPNSVTMIDYNAFSSCSGLTSIDVELGNWHYDSRDNCNAIIETDTNTLVAGCQNTVIPGSVTSIGYGAFSGCSGLTSVTIPNSVTSIGDSAFYCCWGLTSITIPNSVTSIGTSAFSGCSGLKSVTIGNSVTSIGNYAFNKCSGLTSVTIGSGVLSIGTSAFQDLDIKKVIWLTNTPPEGYKNVGSSVHYVSNNLYTGLNNVTVYPYISSLFEVDGIKYVPVSPSERTCDAIDCTYDPTISNFNIGNTVSFKGVEMTLQNINPYTCYNNDYILDFKINFTGNIGNYAFYDCDAIKNVVVNAMTVGESAFYDCNAVTNVEIEAETIGTEAFNVCSKVETITLSENLTSIGASAFRYCSSLKGVVIPDAVTLLGSSAFSGCSSLASVKIGSGISVLNDNTFYGCTSLPAITIPANVTSIGNYVFDYCTSLAELTITDRETELSLGSNGSNPLFSDCPLKSVYIGGNITYPTSSGKGYSPFYRNTSLETVVITDKETEISENEFYGCTALKSVSMGDGVETIGNWAFSGCSSLDFFSFGSGMKTIGTEAFSDCTTMTKLYSKATVPPTCGTQALDDINKWNCELYVPQASIADYQAADQWKEFFFIKDIESGVEDVIVEELVVTVENGEIVVKNAKGIVTVYNITGIAVATETAEGNEVRFDNLQSGIYVVVADGNAIKVKI